MSEEQPRFTSDRRGPSGSSWKGDADWAAGVAENVSVVDGVLVGQAPAQTRQISGDVELYNEGVNEDSWGRGGTFGDPESPTGGTLTKETDHLFVDANPNPDGFNSASWVYNDIIDFGNYREIIVESASQQNEGYVAVVLSPRRYVDIEEWLPIESKPYPRQTDTFDVSGVSSEYYLHLVARDNVVRPHGGDDSLQSEGEFYYVGLNA